MSAVKVQACPTMHGTHNAYDVEYREELDGRWKPVQFNEGSRGVPPTGTVHGVNSTVGLRGYKQAMALAWWFAAEAASKYSLTTQIRVVPYRVEFDIKATKDESAAITIGDILEREP